MTSAIAIADDRSDPVGEMRERISQALSAGDYERALQVAVEQGRWLRACQARGELPEPQVLRQWLDTYQGLIAHVQTLRDDTRRQLQRMQKGRDVTKAYAAA